MSAGSSGSGGPRVSLLSLPKQMSVGKKQISKFIKGSGDRASGIGRSNSLEYNAVGGGVDDEPIADLFHNTSIMFSDIVGK